jgi:hypothetical protein
VFNQPNTLTDPSGEVIPLIVWAGIALLGGGTAGVHYANHERDKAFQAGSDSNGIINYDNIDHRRYKRADYIGAVSEPVAFTGAAVAAAPVLGLGATSAYAFAPTSTVLVGGTLTTLGTVGAVSETALIYSSYDDLDGPERVRRIGNLAGPLLGGGLASNGIPRTTHFEYALNAGLLRGQLNFSLNNSIAPRIQTGLGRRIK